VNYPGINGDISRRANYIDIQWETISWTAIHQTFINVSVRRLHPPAFEAVRRLPTAGRVNYIIYRKKVYSLLLIIDSTTG